MSLPKSKPGVPAPPTEGISTLSTLSTQELRSELNRALDMTAAHLRRLAAIVRLLEERGEDLSDLRLGLLGYLRQIAWGRLLPEIVVRYAEFPSALRAIAALPPPDQERFARGDGVPLIVRREDGSTDKRMADPLRITGEQVRQLFGPRGLRDEAEQILWLESRGKPRVEVTAQDRVTVVRSVKADRVRGGITIGRRFVPAGTLVEALGALHEEESTDTSRDETVVLKLSAREKQRLNERVTAANTTQQAVVRNALRALGII